MHSRFTRWAIGATVALSLFGAVGVAQASSLTPIQVSAIINLLQSFGADQSVINNVSVTLGAPVATSLSCSSFSDVAYGQFDNNLGGRVSQLQTWLGIPSSTFGFGTYGHKTQAAWNRQCALPQPTNTTFSATPTSGAAPLAVVFNFPFSVKGSVDYGDGSTPQMCTTDKAGADCAARGNPHVYASAGTYTAILKDLSGNIVSTTNITVTGQTSATPTAAIDQSSLATSSLHPTFTGTAANIAGSIVICIGPGMTTSLEKNSQVWCSGPILVTSGHWSTTVSPPYSLSPGIFTVFVYVYGVSYPNLTSGTLTVNATN